MVNAGKRDRLWRSFAIATPYLWLLLFFLVPFAIVLKRTRRSLAATRRLI